MEKVGCRPFWINDEIGNKHSLCQNQSQYENHLTQKNSIITMNEAKLNEKIGCMRSCTYMEYKLADEPFNAKWPNLSQVKIMFDRPGVLTETEELAYSLSS